MTKQDQPQDRAVRLREYTRQEREAGTHPSIDTLRHRAKDRTDESRKLAEFTRIERGQTA